MASAPMQPAGSGSQPPPQAGPSRLSPRGWGWMESDPYWYPLNSPLLAVGASGNALLQFDTDADFLWDRIDVASAYPPGPNGFSVYLQDASRGVPLIGSPLAPLFGPNVGANTGLFAPVALLPFWLPKPYRLRRGTVIAAVFNNLSGISISVQLVLTGRKVAPQ